MSEKPKKANLINVIYTLMYLLFKICWLYFRISVPETAILGEKCRFSQYGRSSCRCLYIFERHSLDLKIKFVRSSVTAANCQLSPDCTFL